MADEFASLADKVAVEHRPVVVREVVVAHTLAVADTPVAEGMIVAGYKMVAGILGIAAGVEGIAPVDTRVYDDSNCVYAHSRMLEQAQHIHQSGVHCLSNVGAVPLAYRHIRKAR